MFSLIFRKCQYCPIILLGILSLFFAGCDNKNHHEYSLNLNVSEDSLIDLNELFDKVNVSEQAKLILHISSEDRKKICFRQYSTSDKMKITDLLKKMKCQQEGGDIATLSSYMQLETDGMIIFYANLEISDSLFGIQNSQLGYCSFPMPIKTQSIIELMGY